MARRAGRRYHVFFSCAAEDRFVARLCVRLIEEKGRGRVSVFLYEKSIEGGQSISEEVRRNIRECDEFVVLLTPSSVDRQWVMNEVGAAWMVEKKIVAILDKVSPRNLPDIIQGYRAFDLNDFEDRYIEELLRRVKDRRS